jgi:two-component system, chemotaxis family, chemotaxis protein CheY
LVKQGSNQRKKIIISKKSVFGSATSRPEADQIVEQLKSVNFSNNDIPAWFAGKGTSHVMKLCAGATERNRNHTMTSQKISEGGQSTGTRFKGHLNPRQRILVVDDDEAMRHFNAEVLGSSGYKVDAAADGTIAWDVLQFNDYDLLLTDHKMPKMTGVELLKKLHGARMAVPVIMVSGTMPTMELNRHPWLQIDATLLKPYTCDQLLTTVRKVLHATNGVAGQAEPQSDFQNRPTADCFQF